MTTNLIFPSVHALALGMVNVFMIVDEGALTLVDTGTAGSEGAILDAAQALGYGPETIANIVVTHCHPDHAGSLAALSASTGARVWMHADDAAVVRGSRPMGAPQPAPSPLHRMLFRRIIEGTAPEIAAAEVHHEVSDGEVIPLGGGLRVLHTPGHSAGHVALLLERDGGLLFAADACSNLPVLSWSIVYEDFAEGLRSLARLSSIDCAAICFGHGGALRGSATARFRRKWSG